MVHVRRRFTKTANAEFDPLLPIKFVTHSDMELAGNNGHVFRKTGSRRAPPKQK